MDNFHLHLVHTYGATGTSNRCRATYAFSAGEYFSTIDTASLTQQHGKPSGLLLAGCPSKNIETGHNFPVVLEPVWQHYENVSF